jgi:hypothetical protein
MKQRQIKRACVVIVNHDVQRDGSSDEALVICELDVDASRHSRKS